LGFSTVAVSVNAGAAIVYSTRVLDAYQASAEAAGSAKTG
jgi:hypothetical protein